MYQLSTQSISIWHWNFPWFMCSALSKNFQQTTTEYRFFMSDFVYHVCLQYFFVSRIFNNELLEVNGSVAKSYCSAEFNCAFSWIWANQCFLNFWFCLCSYCIWLAQCQQKSPSIVFFGFYLCVPSSTLRKSIYGSWHWFH